MMGFGSRDYKQGCQGIHDDIHVRALFLQNKGEPALILAYELCFVGREEADRFKGALGREFDLLPRQILINTSHNHVSPAVGTWYWAGYLPPERVYVDQLERATLLAARRAKAAMREAILSVGVGQTELPLSRRKPDGKGGILFAPNPEGVAYKHLPVCLFKDRSGRPVCLLFSASVHPSQKDGWEISAEYPGAACKLLDEHLGTTAAVFLQGTGGDAKPSVIGKGLDKWRPGTWDDVQQSGQMLARETIATLDKELRSIAPAFRSVITETHWPLQPPPPRGDFEAIVTGVKEEDRPKSIRCQWASRQLAILDRGEALPNAAGVILQVMELGTGLRLVGIEGEPVGAWGHLIADFYAPDVTFPLGYCNGQGLYLPVSKMIAEGGYEVESYWEYGYPSRLAAGMEEIVLTALAHMRRSRPLAEPG
jgi:neutral ceramidase